MIIVGLIPERTMISATIYFPERAHVLTSECACNCNKLRTRKPSAHFPIDPIRICITIMLNSNVWTSDVRPCWQPHHIPIRSIWPMPILSSAPYQPSDAYSACRRKPTHTIARIHTCQAAWKGRGDRAGDDLLPFDDAIVISPSSRLDTHIIDLHNESAFISCNIHNTERRI